MGNYSEAVSWASVLAIINRNNYGTRIMRYRGKDYDVC